ncbi:MAG: GNAT family N-acetyltransferase [Proteobacteria bacterium]|nr:GNAT family N-acetyltransferase [Pseudomonadota bacterium]
MKPEGVDRDTIRLIRTFNRQLLRKLHQLNRILSGTELNVTQESILCEIASSRSKSWPQLAESLLIDKGLLSRNLRALEQRHLINRVRNKRDRRRCEFILTQAGKKKAREVDDRADRQIEDLLKSLNASELDPLVGGLKTYGHIMGLHMETPAPVHIRPHKIGDASYVTFLHGILYSREYGLDSTFEVEVGREITEFVSQFDPQRDGFWIAEAGGHVVGAVVIVNRKRGLAQLRWFILHPTYRGLGVGRELMTRAVGFCKGKQYKKVFLWTFDELDAAIHLYRSFGFERREKKTHQRWGRSLTEERYELNLQGGTQLSRT